MPDAIYPRVTNDAVRTWQDEGTVLLPSLLDRTLVAAAEEEMHVLFGHPADRASSTAQITPVEGLGQFDGDQFKFFDNIPFADSPALNLLPLNETLIDFACRALECDQVQLYQGQAWAKYTGQTDFNQPFHCDFLNHTLTVPSEDTRHNSITFIILISDVSEAHGPTHYVPRATSRTYADVHGALHEDVTDAALQAQLNQDARSIAAPAGSLFAYGIDVYHRGTNLTAPGGHRYVMTVCYRRAADDAISYTAWPYTFTKPWHELFEQASPRQLSCLGVPLPGDPFWTAKTIAQTQTRYRTWDATPWLQALK